MPCIECGESARKTCNGLVVGLSYDDDGVAHHTCMNCFIELMENEYDME